jgi:hypothetical protein
MANVGDLFSLDNLTKLYQIVGENPASATLSIVGLACLAIAALLSWKAVRSKPEDMTGLMRAALFTSLAAGVVLSLAGPSISLIGLARDRSRGFEPVKVSKHTVLANLGTNARVSWLVRLIPNDPAAEPELTVARLTHLGRPSQRYTFVADYSELRGYTASEAVLKTGGSMISRTAVSAILFPLHSRQLYPANARGLLQVVAAIDAKRDPAILNYQPFNLESKLSSSEKNDLASGFDSVAAWSWANYGKQFYRHYCDLAHEFRCGSSSARALIGDLSRDWHPLGLALNPPAIADPCAQPQASPQECDFSSWRDTARLEPAVGARVFLIENTELSRLEGRILINFDRPDAQVIPDLGLDLRK